MTRAGDEIRALGRAVEARIGAAHGRMSPAAIGAAVERVRRAVGDPGPAELLARFEAGEHSVVRRLVSELTVGETYFFREPDQIAAVVRFVGEAIALDPSRTVAVWSAGCASGEEPYSIAIRCLEALGDVAEERVRIVATDVSTDAIATAERGIYRAWSFRSTTQAERARWFDASGRVVERPRRLVRFGAHNLLDLPSGPREVDVIVCRNVLLYFAPDRALATLEALADALSASGWLVLGPADPPPLTPRLEATSIGGKLYYRRARPSALPAPRPDETGPRPVERREPPPTDASAVPTRPSLLAPRVTPRTTAARIDAAHALADAGHDARALAALDALVLDAPEPRTHLARGLLRSALGDQRGAAHDAAHAIAHEPGSPVAHVLLAGAQAAQGDALGAARAAQQVLDLLEPLDARSEIPDARGLRVGDLRETAARILRVAQRPRRAR